MSTSSLDADARMQLLWRQIRKIVLLCAPILVGIWLLTSYQDLAAAWTHHGILGVLGKVAGDALGFLIILVVLAIIAYPTTVVARKTGKKLATFAFAFAYTIALFLAIYGTECLVYLLAPRWLDATWPSPLTLYRLEVTLVFSAVVGLFFGWLGTRTVAPLKKYKLIEEGKGGKVEDEEDGMPYDGAVI